MRDLLPKIQSNDGQFHHGNPATGEQGTRVTDTWLNNVQEHIRDFGDEFKYLLKQAELEPDPAQKTQIYDAIEQIIENKRRTATTTEVGEVQLDSSTDSNAEDKAATPKAVNSVRALVTAVRSALNNYIPNSKKSSAVNSTSSDTVATSYAVKQAYDAATQIASDTIAGKVMLSHIINGVSKLKAASEFALNELNKRVLKNSGTQTLNNGDFEIKNGSYSSVKLYNNNNKHVRIEAQPDSTQDSFAHIILKNQQDSNLKRVKIPRKDGILVVDGDFSYQKIGDFEVRKYPDGTMIQIYQYTQDDVYYNSRLNFTWAQAFFDKPFIFTSVATNNETHNSYPVYCGIDLNKSTKSVCHYLLREAYEVSQNGLVLTFLAIGRWK